jgi:hypothetical protein
MELGDLEGIRRKLDDLLYDFEDYMDVDGFDEERFTEIQSTAKSFALNVIDIIKRLKIDGLPITPPPRLTPFPPLPPLPPLSSLGALQPGSPPLAKTAINLPRPDRRRSKGRSPEVRSATPAQVQPILKETSSDMTKPRGASRLVSDHSKPWRTSSAISVDQLPPYSRQQQPAGSHEDEHNNILAEHGTVDAVIPEIDIVEELRRCSSPDILGEDRSHVRPVDSSSSRKTSQPSAIDMISAFPMPLTTTWASSQHPASAPLRPHPQRVREPMHSNVIAANDIVTYDTMDSHNSLRPTVSKSRAPTKREAENRLLPMHQKDGERASVNTGISRPSNNSSITSPLKEKLDGPLLLPAGNAEVPLPQAGHYHDGLMLAEDCETASMSIKSTAKFGAISSNTDCSLGSNSSLSLMKGFCDGAQSFRKGSHWHGVKKMSGYVAVRTR